MSGDARPGARRRFRYEPFPDLDLRRAARPASTHASSISAREGWT